MKLHEIKSKEKSAADLHIDYDGGDFDCSSNELTSLFGAPSSVNGNFYCYSNELTSLVGAPSSIGGDFYCGNNKLKSLVGAPSAVGGDFYCSYNKLTSLVGAPSSIGGDFYCGNNKLMSLVGAPSSVGGDFNCFNNKLISLQDIYKQIRKIKGGFYAHSNPIKSHALGLLLITGITKVKLDNLQVMDILNKHLPSRGMHDVLEAQDELIEAGLDEFAQL